MLRSWPAICYYMSELMERWRYIVPSRGAEEEACLYILHMMVRGDDIEMRRRDIERYY